MGIETKNFVLVLLFFFSSLLQSHSTFAKKKPYVVYFGGHSHKKDEISPLTEERVTNSHFELLGSVLKSKEKAKDVIVYSYTKFINGFAANLQEEEAMEISKYPGVISVFPSRAYKLHTTHSWEFLGLEKNGMVPKKSLWSKADFGEDVIIGNLDTGVWPESESFKDDGIGPVPSKWKGICQSDSDEKFHCNRKLIGARYFKNGYESTVGKKLNSTYTTPRDTEGHGTHTLSTAGGGAVSNANIYGYGNGTAKGGSPRSRLAAYKVCWPKINGDEGSCFDADILAAFEAAIYDGVDVLSISLGADPTDFTRDGLAIGSFHAVMNGITVVCSGGNSGPKAGTVSNIAPWLLTVGASTMDREFPAFLSYDGKRVKGQSLSSTSLSSKKRYPMISSTYAKASNSSLSDSQLCVPGSLDPKKAKGKIIVCLRGINARTQKGMTVLHAGGAGMVLANNEKTGDELIADAHVLPATHISYLDSIKVFACINSTKSPYGYITKPKTQLNTKPAPFMAAFSSQGPNLINPEILKPDITAPGVNVLASWSQASPPTDLEDDSRRVLFNSVSGTSMSCPHVAGIVGLFRKLHPDWSPAAISSAIMTSARVTDNNGNALTNSSADRATPFSYGSGHIWPNRAIDPGLVYDLNTNDYLDFLCALGSNSTQIQIFSIMPYVCPSKPIRIEDLNYPSITVPNLSGLTSVTRTVKNVGPPSTYSARVIAPPGVLVVIKPSTLKFSKTGEEKKFKVFFKAKKSGPMDYAFGGLIWSDGKHYVRSPIVVKA